MIFDSHCHLQFKAYENERQKVISRCSQKDTLMILVGTQEETSEKAVKLADRHDNMWSTVGLHPIQSKKVKVEEEGTSFVARGEDFDLQYYGNLIESSENVVGVGETGLDKHHIPKDKDVDSIMDDQWSAYEKHIELARKYDLPVVMHVREAHDEMIKRLRDVSIDFEGVVHCFSSDWSHAKEYLNMGFHIGFTGIITFPPRSSDPQSQYDLWKVVEKTPLNKILVETDAPFLAPQKYRGDRAEPWMISEVIQKVADIKSIGYDEVCSQTIENTKSVFGITSLNI